MYSNVKSTGLPLGLFSTLMFSGNTLVYLQLLFQRILDYSRLFDIYIYSCGHKNRDTCNFYEMVLICFALNTRTLNIVTLKFNNFNQK